MTKKGRPSKWNKIEKEILNKCKHPTVQRFLKEKIFRKDFMTCLHYLDMVSYWIIDIHDKKQKEEYRAIWKNILRYIFKQFSNEDLKLYYPNIKFYDPDGKKQHKQKIPNPDEDDYHSE